MDMKEHILSVAQRLVQQRGFNGFSYADIAEEVGIRKASLHHHFSGKADLGLALIDGYTEQLNQELKRISSQPVQADKKLAAYIAIYRSTLVADRMCLGGMLASEALTLDVAMLPSIKRFFARNTEWLAEVLAEGKAQQLFHFYGAAVDQARMLLAALQGALLLARAASDHEAFEQTATALIAGLVRKS